MPYLHDVVMAVTSQHYQNWLISSDLSILIYCVISLPDAMSYDGMKTLFLRLQILSIICCVSSAVLLKGFL